MMLGQFDSALSDLNELQNLLFAVDKRELEEQFYQKILAKAYIKIYAIHGIKNEYKLNKKGQCSRIRKLLIVSNYHRGPSS